MLLHTFCVCACAFSVIQSCLTLHDPMDCSVRGIFQATILEWVAIFCSRVSPDRGIELPSLVPSVLSGGFFTTEPLGKSTHD